MIVANGKFQLGVINRKREIAVRTLVDRAWGFRSITNLTKKGIRQAAEIVFKTSKASTV